MSSTDSSSDSDAGNEDERREFMANCHEIILFLKEKNDIGSYKGAKDILGAINRLGNEYKKSDLSLSNIRLISYEMIKNGVSKILCKTLMEFSPSKWRRQSSEVDDHVFNAFKSAAEIASANCAVSQEFRESVSAMDGFFESLLHALKYNMEITEKVKKELSESEEYEQRAFVAIISFCANMEGNRTRLRKTDFKNILFAYLKRKEDEAGLTYALLGLAGVMSEEESKELDANREALEMLLTAFKEAFKNRDDQERFFEVLAVGVKNLATYDSIGPILINLGILKKIRKICQVGAHKDQHAALTILLTLSFNDANKLKIMAEPALLKRIRHLYLKSTHENTRREAKCILWVLRHHLALCKKYENTGIELCSMEEKISQNASGSHVMISYNRTHQSEVFIVRNKLQQRGFKTWMYVDDIGAFSLDSMLEAVRNAEAIVICLSQPYKDSTYLRLKLEYASKSVKKLIPLIVERGYEADGWLGRVIANIPCYNIFEESFDLQICEALGINGEATGTSHEASDETIEKEFIKPAIETDQMPKTVASKRDIIEGWSKDDMWEWLRGKPFSSNTPVSRLCGSDLVFLWDLHQTAPEQFYKKMESELDLESIPALRSFVGALMELLE